MKDTIGGNTVLEGSAATGSILLFPWLLLLEKHWEGLFLAILACSDGLHTIPELQLALQTFFDTICLLVRSFFNQRPQTGGMICQ